MGTQIRLMRNLNKYDINLMARYSFSGHETFTCKSLWLKKGYDYLADKHKFTDDDAVVHLGVGKNMVASIRFWLKAFGLTQNDSLTSIAHYLFSETGRDLYCEDITTLWLLHYYLIKNQVASLYNLLFLGLQRELKSFDREQLQTYVKRKCNVPEQKNVYNENTVKKDIGVLLANYVTPSSTKSLEDFNALLIDLGLIRTVDNKYVFNQTDPSSITKEVVLFALLDYDEQTISYDQLQELSLVFCLSIPNLISIIQSLSKEYSSNVVYTDNAGIKNVQFIGEKMDKFEILDKYYIR